MYPSAGLVRYSTVGGPAPVSTCWIRAARPAHPERAVPEASPPGLEEFLQRLHLASYTASWHPPFPPCGRSAVRAVRAEQPDGFCYPDPDENEPGISAMTFVEFVVG